MEASVEPFVFVTEFIDDDWRLKNQLQLPENKIFSGTEKNFLGKLRKMRKEKKMQNLQEFRNFALIPYHKFKN